MNTLILYCYIRMETSYMYSLCEACSTFHFQLQLPSWTNSTSPSYHLSHLFNACLWHTRNVFDVLGLLLVYPISLSALSFTLSRRVWRILWHETVWIEYYDDDDDDGEDVEATNIVHNIYPCSAWGKKCVRYYVLLRYELSKPLKLFRIHFISFGIVVIA